MFNEKEFFIQQLIVWTNNYLEGGKNNKALSTAYPYIYRRYEFFKSTQICYSEKAALVLKEITSEQIDLLHCNWYTRVFINKIGKKDYLHKYLAWEHYTTGYDFKNQLIKLYPDRLNVENVNTLLKKQKMAWITKEEDKVLSNKGYKKHRQNPDYAYNDAKIKIIKCSSFI